MPKRSVNPLRGFFPQPMYLMGCYKEDGSPNFTLKTWVTFATAHPPTLLFAAEDAGRGRKKTADRILETGVFSANLVMVDMLPYADYCGAVSGYETDKCVGAGVPVSRGTVLDVPVLDDSSWIYECQVVKTVEAGNGTVFFGEVRNMIVDERVPDPGYGKVDVLSLNPAIYAPGRYFALSEQVATVGDPAKRIEQQEAPAGSK